MKTIHNSDSRGNSKVQNHKTYQWGEDGNRLQTTHFTPYHHLARKISNSSFKWESIHFLLFNIRWL